MHSGCLLCVPHKMGDWIFACRVQQAFQCQVDTKEAVLRLSCCRIFTSWKARSKLTRSINGVESQIEKWVTSLTAILEQKYESRQMTKWRNFCVWMNSHTTILRWNTGWSLKLVRKGHTSQVGSFWNTLVFMEELIYGVIRTVHIWSDVQVFSPLLMPSQKKHVNVIPVVKQKNNNKQTNKKTRARSSLRQAIKVTKKFGS